MQQETHNLVTALRSPQTRGRWGEMTLRRSVEAAGMLAHVDFDEQQSTASEGGLLRPDMVVHLPGGGEVVIDSKVPLDAFLHFTEAQNEEDRKGFLAKHARQLRTHVDQLAKKEYWKQYDGSPEFVVAFIPGEPLLAAACEADATLQDYALNKRVVLATPNTLVAALRTIALSWRQDTLAENAREVKELGAELYERLRTWTGHMQSLQKSLASSVDAYNRAVGSLESRVLVTARKLPGLGRHRRGLGPDPGAGSDRVGAPAPPGGRAGRRRGRASDSRPSSRCRTQPRGQRQHRHVTLPRGA